MQTVYIILALALWGFVHSLLASIRFKDFMQKTFGAGFMRIYRLGYNAFAFVSFLPVLYLVAAAPSQLLYAVPAPWSYAMNALQGISVFFLLVTVLQTDLLSFIGVKQLFVVETQGELMTSGFYRYMRHPLYTFSVAFLWLSPILSVNSFVFYIGAMLYLYIGALFEERKLLREFGQAYAEYKAATPMFIPRLKRA